MISKIKIIFIPLAVVCSIFLFSPNTFAEDPSTLEKLKNKSYLQGAYKCFRGTVLVGNDAVRNYPLSTQGEYISKVSDPQVPDKIEHFDTFRAIAPFTSSADSLSNKVYLPNGLTEESNAKDSDAATNCAHLLNGKDYLLEDKDGDGFTTSIYKRFGKKEPDPGSDDFESIMDQIGYTPDSSKDGANCFRIRYKYAIINAEGKGDLSGPDYYLANRYCMDVNSKGYVEKLVEEPETDTVKYPIVVGPKGEPSAFDLTSGSTDVSFVASGGTSGAYVIPYRSDRGPSDVKYYDGTDSFYNAISPNIKKVKKEDFINVLQKMANNLVPEDTMYGNYVGGDIYGGEVKDKFAVIFEVKVEPYSISSDTMVIADRAVAADKIVKYLSGSDYNSALVTKSERVVLYQYYITGVAHFNVKCEDDGTTSNYTPVKWFRAKDKREDCWIYGGVVSDNSTEYTTVTPQGLFIGRGNLAKVIELLNKIDIDKLEDVKDDELTTIMDMADITDDENERVAPSCYDHAGALGWILCPIITTASDAIQGIYEKMITKFLVLDAELFRHEPGDGGATVYATWQQFQNFANIAFVIVFLFVIFSQLTGVGIDNYGIKKIMPKLIVTALLINLSYIICQLAIDVANIVGYGIGQILENVGTTPTVISFTEDPTGATTGDKFKQVAAVCILVILVAALAVAAYLAIGPAVLIPVFLGLISVLIGIIFLFVMLAVRKAFAVILVVISPMAFVCYMLPNTKSLFDKWFNSFKMVILAFPICSAMVYGGQAVARIIVSVANQSNADGAATLPSAVALSAAVISVAPIFLIPKVLKGSMGIVSGTIDNLRRGVTSKAQKRANDSNRFADMRRRTQMNSIRRAGGLDRNGEVTARARKREEREAKFREGKIGQLKIGNRNVGKWIADARYNARNERIANARGTYIKEQSEITGNAVMSSTAGYGREKFNSEVNDYMQSQEFAALTGNGNMDTAYASFVELAQNGNMNDEQKKQFVALAKVMAANKDGKKLLAKAIRNTDMSSDSFKMLAQESDVVSGVGDKDRYVEAALKNAEQFRNFQSWSTGTGSQERIAKVASKLDKTDFYSQSSDARDMTMLAKWSNGQYVRDDDTFVRENKNQNIDRGEDAPLYTAIVDPSNSGKSREQIVQEHRDKLKGNQA